MILRLLVVVVASALPNAYSQTLPTIIPPSRPPPIQEIDYVGDFLDDILAVSSYASLPALHLHFVGS